jgi:hypothetical protein
LAWLESPRAAVPQRGFPVLIRKLVVLGAGEALFQPQRIALEPVPEKLPDFSAKNMLQLVNFEHLLLARVIQPERKRL